jgi:hypothetical protein
VKPEPEPALRRVGRVGAALDLPAAGIGAALVAVIVLVAVFGVLPTAAVLGVLALLVVD